MSNQEITTQFRKFGNKLIPILILTVISSVFFLIFTIYLLTHSVYLIFYNLNYSRWLYYGIYLQILIWFIFLFMLGNIKNIADAHLNSELLSFRSKMIALSILRIIGFFVQLNAIYILTSISSTRYGTTSSYLIVFGAICMGISLIVLFIAAILEIVAWVRLSSGLSLILPANNAKAGAILCMVGAIIDVIIPLWFILRSLSGIFRIIGFILLIFYLYNLTEDNIAPAPPRSSLSIRVQPAASATQLTPVSTLSDSSIIYCPACGINVKPGAKYCTSCGRELK